MSRGFHNIVALVAFACVLAIPLSGRAQAPSGDVPPAPYEPWSKALRRAGVLGPVGPPPKPCPPQKEGEVPSPCNLNLNARVEDAIFLPRVFTVEGSYGQSLCVRRMLCKEFRRAMKGTKRWKFSMPWSLNRLQFEFLLSMVAVVKQFYYSVEDDRDRGYATVGQFTAAYRHVLFADEEDKFLRRLALVAYAYKLGVSTPVLRHTYEGGCLALEINAYEYQRKSDRVLFRLAPLGVLREKFSKPQYKIGVKRYYLESMWTVEGLWRMGPTTLVVTGSVMPRYALKWTMRFESEIALRVRIPVQTMAPMWVNEVQLVPKVTYMYTSSPVLVDAYTPDVLSLLQSAGFLRMADYKQNLTAYVHVQVQLGK